MAQQYKGRPANDEKKPGSRPDFILRARQAPDKDGKPSEFFQTIGAAWSLEVNGQQAYSVKLQSIPVGGWDGSLIMLPPKAED